MTASMMCREVMMVGVYHVHCRWFLVPPGEAFYSKIHPLYWQFKDATEVRYIACLLYIALVGLMPFSVAG